ncbi:MAG TPA: tetratricopeptide repeat protein [Labilithrix sp.]|nr:tetratricopeptide repeat protein [Labilithrix sp.]
MADTNPRDREDADAEDEPYSDELDLGGLKARADVDGLLALARAYRTGKAPGGRDLARCLEAYRAAAELGSRDAEYAIALFCMTGGVVPQDFKEGAARLRSAAEKGSIAAKVYLGNMYELGIHYKADPEKADVWYRNAARSARIESAPGGDDYARELAELGCVRYVLALVDEGSVQGDEAARLVQRARAHGYGVRSKTESLDFGPSQSEASPPARASLSAPLLDALQTNDEAQGASAQRPSAGKGANPTAPSVSHPKVKRPAPGPSRVAIGLGAFGYALLFTLAGLGAAYAAMLGARELLVHGKVLPGLGTRAELVFPIVLGLVGVLPTSLVYRFGAVLKAIVAGTVLGGIGWIAWGTGQGAFVALRSAQATAFGLAGFLAALLAFGLLGGTRRQPPSDRRRPTSAHR